MSRQGRLASGSGAARRPWHSARARHANERWSPLRADSRLPLAGTRLGGHAAQGQEPAPRSPRSWFQDVGRSEEHTSELQSLMRISYAVFCLKKKKETYITDSNTHTQYRHCVCLYTRII